MFNLGKTNAGLTLVQTNLLSFLTIIPKAIFGLIGLARSFGMSAVAATGLNGVLKVLKIDPIMLAISAIVAIGYGAVKVIDALTTSFDEQKEIVASLKSEIQSLQSEYEALSGKPNKTEQESAYLDVLRAEIELKKQDLIIEAKRAHQKYINSQIPVGTIGAANILKGDYGGGELAAQNVKKYNAQIANLDVSSKNYKKTLESLTLKRSKEVAKMIVERDLLQDRVDVGDELTESEENRLNKYNDLIVATNGFTDATQDGNDSLEEQIGTVSG
ncbi:MAG: hypothetical protein RR365_06140, partial [Bacteroides sp.]